MNYVREINAFYNELELNPLSPSAIVLWYALLHLCNKSGWKDRFAVPVGTLSLKTGLSERSISNARNELKTKGYIDFQSRGANRSAVYSIKPLSAKFADTISNSGSDTASGSVSDYTSDSGSALYKQNNSGGGGAHERDIIDINFAKALWAIEAQFPARINPVQADKLARHIANGLDPEIVVRAVEITRLAGKGIAYLWGILDNCEDRGIWTIEAFEAEQRKRAAGEHKSSAGSRSSYYERKAREAERDES